MRQLALLTHRFLQVAAFAFAAIAAPVKATPCGTGNYPFPFTDVGGVADAFCVGIMEAFVVGITKGTTATTFSPNDNVPRVQMTTFLQRSFDQGVKRGGRRAALDQWWTPRVPAAMQAIPLGGFARYCAADGEHIWAPTLTGLVQVQASTGKVLGTWTGMTAGRRPVVAAGKVFVTERTQPGVLNLVDPTLPPGPVTVAASNLGNQTVGLAFDGTKLWAANASGSVSIITLQATLPYPVLTISTGFSSPTGITFDGANIWVTDYAAGTLLKLDAAGAIVQTVQVGVNPGQPVFDGGNLWVPNLTDNSITVVAASTGAIVGTITAATDGGATQIAFDGERMLVTGQNENVYLFKAADLSPLGNASTGPGTGPYGTCSDGINFWVTLPGTNQLLRL